MWKEYFTFIKLKPGRVVTTLFGEIDFSRDNIPLEKIVQLYENDFPYLQITEKGKQLIYGLEECDPSPITHHPLPITPEESTAKSKKPTAKSKKKH